MNQNLHSRENVQTPGGRSWSRVAIISLLILCAGSLAIFLRKGHVPKAPMTTQTLAQPEIVSEPAPDSPQPATSVSATPSPTVNRPSPVIATLALPEPTAQSRALVASLTRLDQSSSVTADQAAEWKTNLMQLAQQGASGAAAIREFLQKSVDMDFGPTGGQMLGYTSARVAMFGALQEIGGPEALGVMLETLQTTADPREIALLAQSVETLEPEQHRQELLAAARQTLEQASGHKLETADVAPLFEVLQKYGASNVVPDLEKAAQQWSYYGPIALGLLPDNAGVPSLIQMVQDPKATVTVRDAAFQMLAQLSTGSAEARAALIEQARLNRMSEFAWRIAAPVLAGDEVGLLNSAFADRGGLTQVGGVRTTGTSDNQHFFSAPVNLTPEQASERIGLIDELLSVTADPTAREILQQSKDSLSRRVPQVAASRS